MACCSFVSRVRTRPANPRPPAIVTARVPGYDRNNVGGEAATRVRAPGSIFSNPPLSIFLLLVAVRVVVLAATMRADLDRPVVDDLVSRFGQIATTRGTPYRDFAVEYMPIELVTIRTMFADGPSATATRLAIISFVAELAAAGALWYGWGHRAATTYLLIGLPLQTFILFRIDPVATALAAWSMAMARRGREGRAGVLLALATLTKVWPVVLLPWFFVKRRGRTLAWYGTVTAVGLLAWVAIGGIRAPWQVLTFRGSTGWEIESTVGFILLLVTGGPTRMEAGASRIGVASLSERGALLVGIGCVVALVWARARKEPDVDPAGGPALTCITTLVALSPLFSVQYSYWLLPWATVGLFGTRRERFVSLIGVGIVAIGGALGLLLAANATAHVVVAIKVLLAIRNVACIALVVYWFLTGRRLSPRSARSWREGASRLELLG